IPVRDRSRAPFSAAMETPRPKRELRRPGSADDDPGAGGRPARRVTDRVGSRGPAGRRGPHASAGRRPAPGSERIRRLRRRVDALALRVQGRFDSDWSDRVLPWLCAGGLFIVLILLALARVRSFETTIDHAAAIQATWLIHHGLPPVLTVTTN